MRKYNILDTSEDLLVQRYGTGVRLIRPDNFHRYKEMDDKYILPPSVKSLFQMPCNVYFLNTESVIQNMSDTAANVCGFQGKKDAIGNTARTVSKKESAEFSIMHNNEVISRNSIVIKDEHFLRLDGFEFRDIAIKFPLLDDNGKIMGVFGCSIIIDLLAESFHLLMKTGLLVDTHIFTRSRNYYSIYLDSDISQQTIDDLSRKLSVKTKKLISKREIECLLHLMKGKSARETGIQLNRSQRTVEHYINSLKDKLSCAKKSEIIETVLRLIRK